MRPTVIFTLAALVLTVGEPIRADQPVYQSGLNPYEAGACAAPNYGAADIQQPCNHCPSRCCDDVWAGYCQEKQQGFCLPCIRPFGLRCAPVAKASCSECEIPAEASPSEPTPKPEAVPVPKGSSKPTLAPELPPPPASPKPLPNMSETESPSDTTSVPFPMFNPSAWKIGEPAK